MRIIDRRRQLDPGVAQELSSGLQLRRRASVSAETGVFARPSLLYARIATSRSPALSDVINFLQQGDGVFLGHHSDQLDAQCVLTRAVKCSATGA